MGVKGQKKFAAGFWLALGLIAGIVLGAGMGARAGYDVGLCILCALGGGLAGAVVLPVLMWLNYIECRADLFSKE
jgi:F0F1-type ATP synthase assembly protein I